MSGLTTAILQSSPSGAVGFTISIGAGAAWANSSYTEFITSASADMYVAGITAVPTSGITEFEVDIATGTAGSETVVGTIPGAVASSGVSGMPCWIPLPVPVQIIGAGNRVALRIRTNATSAESITLTLLYYDAAPGDNYTTLPPACVPSAASAVSVTPDATAWANSSWVALTTGLGTDAQIYGVAWRFPSGISFLDLEMDLGVGASGSESVITTWRAAIVGSVKAKNWYLTLPALYPVTASTRIAVRMRKAGTNTTAHTVKLGYLVGSVAPPVGPSGFPALLVAL